MQSTPNAPLVSGNVVLNWSAFTGATGYRIYRGLVPYFAPTIGTPYASTGAGVTTYTDTGVLGEGIDRYYIITAIQADGKEIRYDNAAGKAEHLVKDGVSSIPYQAFNDYPVQVDIGSPTPENFALDMEDQHGWSNGTCSGDSTIDQVLHWRNDIQNFEAYSHGFCFGDAFNMDMGEWYYLTINQAGGSGFDDWQFNTVGAVPPLGSKKYALNSLFGVAGLYAISAPGWRTDLNDMNKLANAIGVASDGGTNQPSVDQILNWENALQNFLAWANTFQFGDNGVVEPWDGFFVTIADPPGAPPFWP
jgi:hypothetical protein